MDRGAAMQTMLRLVRILSSSMTSQWRASGLAPRRARTAGRAVVVRTPIGSVMRSLKVGQVAGSVARPASTRSTPRACGRPGAATPSGPPPSPPPLPAPPLPALLLLAPPLPAPPLLALPLPGAQGQAVASEPAPLPPPSSPLRAPRRSHRFGRPRARPASVTTMVCGGCTSLLRRATLLAIGAPAPPRSSPSWSLQETKTE
mmetsp:Transcript_22202/g.48531  ORF Transcript_22202/g.48531 Transcript_22202/m.48531 type:complete len:202 (-) Transcript_22202:655-1260(-)